MTTKLRALRPNDIGNVWRNMRAADKAEMLALGLDPLDALIRSVHASEWTTVLEGDGRPLLVAGLAHASNDYGVPWMLATDGIYRHRSAFMRAAREVVARMQAEYPYLANHCDSRNTATLRWLAALGFTIHSDDAHVITAPTGVAFYPFSWERPRV